MCISYFLEKKTYEKVVASFTNEWKKTQDELLQILKQQDENFSRSMREEKQIEENMLKNHRKEIEKILERDRLETSRMLALCLNGFQNSTQRANIPLLLYPQEFGNSATCMNGFFPRSTTSRFSTPSPQSSSSDQLISASSPPLSTIDISTHLIDETSASPTN